MKEKILVWAYFDKNFGDDLFIKILIDRYEMHEFYLINCTDKAFKPFSNYKNAKKINFKDAMKLIYKFKYFINIGGSIFQFGDSKWGSIKKRILISFLNKITGGKNFILGSNFGPYSKSEAIKNTKLYFSLCEDVCLRDKNSYSIFQSMKNVRYAPDIVFGMKITDQGKKITNSIGISIMELQNRKELKQFKEDYIKKMREIIIYFSERKINVYLISFCKAEGDELAINEIVQGIPNSDYIKILSYNGNIKEFLYQYSRIENMISCRFHSFILSQDYRQNTFPIIYSGKMMNALEDMKMDKYYIEIKNISKLSIDIIEEAFLLNDTPNIDIFSDSIRQFCILDKLLLNE